MCMLTHVNKSNDLSKKNRRAKQTYGPERNLIARIIVVIAIFIFLINRSKIVQRIL